MTSTFLILKWRILGRQPFKTFIGTAQRAPSRYCAIVSKPSSGRSLFAPKGAKVSCTCASRRRPEEGARAQPARVHFSNRPLVDAKPAAPLKGFRQPSPFHDKVSRLRHGTLSRPKYSVAARAPLVARRRFAKPRHFIYMQDVRLCRCDPFPMNYDVELGFHCSAPLSRCVGLRGAHLRPQYSSSLLTDQLATLGARDRQPLFTKKNVAVPQLTPAAAEQRAPFHFHDADLGRRFFACAPQVRKQAPSLLRSEHGRKVTKQARVSRLLRTCNLLIILNPNDNQVAVREASRTSLPILSFVDSNTLTAGITYPVLGNIGSLKFFHLFFSWIVKFVRSRGFQSRIFLGRGDSPGGGTATHASERTL